MLCVYSLQNITYLIIFCIRRGSVEHSHPLPRLWLALPFVLELLGRISLKAVPASPSPSCQPVLPAPQRLVAQSVVTCQDICCWHSRTSSSCFILPYYFPLLSWRTEITEDKCKSLPFSEEVTCAALTLSPPLLNPTALHNSSPPV